MGRPFFRDKIKNTFFFGVDIFSTIYKTHQNCHEYMTLWPKMTEKTWMSCNFFLENGEVFFENNIFKIKSIKLCSAH